MRAIQLLTLYTSLVITTIFTSQLHACSFYKLTDNQKTIVGANEDNWRLAPHMWFTKSTESELACCFTGSRSIGKNKYAAQSGMNEAGLVFSRLASYHPKLGKNVNKPVIQHPDQFLIDVLKSCKTIDEVQQQFEKFNLDCFIQDVFVYVQSNGDYLIVEPYSFIKGSDPTLVQANFCPSITIEADRNKQNRYKDGKNKIALGFNTSAEYAQALSKEMHVCRDKIGDGTLLTSIWDSKEMTVTLYFYHNFKEKVVFHLQEEFQKGEHQLAVDQLFSENPEFQQLKSYITPFNADWLRILIALTGLIFALSGLTFLTTIFFDPNKKSKLARLGIAVFLSISFGYMFVLATNQNIYYFSAPYQHFNSKLISLSSFTPYLLILFIVTLGYLRLKTSIFQKWKRFSKVLLSINIVLLVALIPLFFYWILL